MELRANISRFGTNDKIPHRLKGIKSLDRLISFFELLGTYVGSDYGRQIAYVVQIFCGYQFQSSLTIYGGASF